MPVDSPLGIPAGPLLNSRWVLYYSRLGFSVLTYKTVRSGRRACYDPPNLLPVSAPPLRRGGDPVEVAQDEPARSWAISFGMPSKDPGVWQEDVARARAGLREGQVLVVSVVASPEEDWTLDRIAGDFASCARRAAEAGAHAVEANLSCPNVTSREGHLYASPEASRAVAEAMKRALGATPLILKVGLFSGRPEARSFVEAVGDRPSALSTVNSVSAVVVDREGRKRFGGLTRGIGGACIRERCTAEVAMLREVLRETGSALQLIGVGGVFTAGDVRERLAAGAHHVQLATAPMLDPMVGIRIRSELGQA